MRMNTINSNFPAQVEYAGNSWKVLSNYSSLTISLSLNGLVEAKQNKEKRIERLGEIRVIIIIRLKGKVSNFY